MIKRCSFMLILLALLLLLPHSRLQQSDRRSRVLNTNIFQPFQNSYNCRTPTGDAGVCSAITQCIYLIFDLNRLRQSVCFRPFSMPGVCCPATESATSTVATATTTDKLDKLSTLTTSTSTYDNFTSSLPSTTVIWPTEADITTTSVATTDATTHISNETFTDSSVFKQPLIAETERGCGYSGRDGRIVGGFEAEPGRWPWMAAIYLITHRGREYWCGGTLIDKRHVITAAHCLIHKSGRRYHPRSMIVRLAAHRIYNHYDRKNTIDVYVKKTIPHAKFLRHGFFNDIGIIELASEVKYNIDISPICLPSAKMVDNTMEGYMATVLGWGVISYGGRNAETLQQVSVPIWDNENCQKRYVQKITNGMLCAGYHEGLKDACQGDSGGPLMVPNNRRRWILVGIVSFGSKCGEKEQPGVYTRVTHYLDWIRQATTS